MANLFFYKTLFIIFYAKINFCIGLIFFHFEVWFGFIFVKKWDYCEYVWRRELIVTLLSGGLIVYLSKFTDAKHT